MHHLLIRKSIIERLRRLPPLHTRTVRRKLQGHQDIHVTTHLNRARKPRSMLLRCILSQLPNGNHRRLTRSSMIHIQMKPIHTKLMRRTKDGPSLSRLIINPNPRKINLNTIRSHLLTRMIQMAQHRHRRLMSHSPIKLQ